MKTNFKLLAIAMGIAFAIACSSIVIMSCNTSPKDKENELENAQEEVVEAQEALEQSKQTQHIVILYKDRHSEQKPRWFLQASCEP